jgi:hypothetical protein
MDPALVAMLTETVTQTPYSGQDSYGKPTYGASFTRPARVEYRVRLVVDASGQQRASRAKVFLDGDVPVEMRDTFTLEDGTQPPILALYPVRDEFGVLSHYEIML